MYDLILVLVALGGRAVLPTSWWDLRVAKRNSPLLRWRQISRRYCADGPRRLLVDILIAIVIFRLCYRDISLEVSRMEHYILSAVASVEGRS